MKRYCLSLDLVDDSNLIHEYEEYHKKVWPEIIQSLHDSGILHMEIYRVINRLFMIIETNEDFSFDFKAELDAANPKVQEWERLMQKYQQNLPVVKSSANWGNGWVKMDRVFSLDEYKK